MIEKEEFKNKINSVVNHIKNSDTTNATTELLNIIDDFNTGFDELEVEKSKNTTLETTKTELETKINSLKDVNMDLLLRVGTNHNNGGTPTPNINKPTEEEVKPRRFEDLFNEKGELK